MPFNTTAALQLFKARKHLPAGGSTCQLCHHVLSVTDDCLRWLISQAPRHDFLNASILEEILALDRLQREPTVPRFFEALGMRHEITLDSNSQTGSLVVDFNTDISRDPGFTRTFDVVDNCGVTEHVFDQRAIYENIHRLCKVGGLMMHRSPMFGIMNIMLFGVSPLLFRDLAVANGYELIELCVANRWGDRVRALLPGDDGTEEDYRAAIPSAPGDVAEGGASAFFGCSTIPSEHLPDEMLLPPWLTQEEMLRKTPTPNLDYPLARVCRTLEKRATPFRPESPGEIYAMAIYRKLHDEPFRVPYQSNNLHAIEGEAFRERYRRQIEAAEQAVTT